MKRLLFVITGLGVGGAETQVVALAKGLQARGWEIQVVSLTPPGALAEELQRSGIPVISLGMCKRISQPQPVARLACLIRSWRPYVVHAHMFHANILARLARPLAPVPVLLCTAHSTYEASTRTKTVKEITWRERAYRLTDPLCDLTTQISQAGLQRYIAVRAVPSQKIRLVCNGIDTERFQLDAADRQRIRTEHRLEETFLWLAAGRLEVQKDYSTLLRAFARLDRCCSVLWIAGEGRLRAELESLSRSLGLADRVRFLGQRGDIPALMSAADAFVLSSAWEGFGLVIAEALACKLPVVVTDSGGPREVVDNGRVGFLVPPRDPDALAQAMVRLMDLPEAERRRMGELGREHVVANYSLDHVVDQWEALYAELLDRSGAQPRRMALRGEEGVNRFLWAGAVGASLLLGVVLRQPMVGVLLASSACAAAALGRSVRVLPWVVLALKLALLAAVSLLVPLLWPEGGGLIPGNPDQHLYVETADRIADALRVSPLSVDYAGIVGLHNRSYSVALGWLAYLNGGGNLFLYRLFNVFISLLLAGLAYALARRLYPLSLQAASLVFLGVSVLPSVNAYSMFILRDVLIAAIVMSVALGLLSRRYWLVIVGLVMAYFTRIQLFFLLVGAVALFWALRFGRRFGRYGSVLRGALLAAFVIGGFFVAPLVLPPEYDYSHALSLVSFGRFLVHLVPSLFGLDFLLVDPGSLELGRSTLAAARLLLVDTWIVPLLFVGIALHYRRMKSQWREFYLWVWALTIGYMAGYWIAYGTVFVRLLMPLYPLFLLAVPAVMLKGKAPASVHG